MKLHEVMADHRSLAEIVKDSEDKTRCPFCRQTIDNADYMYRISGGDIDKELGIPELWACWQCVNDAETGSIMSKPRNQYPEDFRGFGPY